MEILKNSPYEYVQGEMWHILAHMMPHQQMRSFIKRAVDAAKDNRASLPLKWGACHFLCAAEKAGLGNYAKFVMFQKNPLLLALIVPFLPDGRFGKNDVAEWILRRSALEPGIALSEPFMRLNLSPTNFNIQPQDLPKQVQNVFNGLGIIQGSVSGVDPLGEIITRRYGIPKWTGWKTLLGREYTYALQLLSIADSAY